MNMARWSIVGMAIVFAAVSSVPAQPDSLWQIRDPRMANMFQDYRARNLGDLLTIVVNETTEFGALETRQLNKETKNGHTFGFKMSAGTDAGSTGASADVDTQNATKRKFDGTNNSTIDRKFVDRMTVTVVGVMPNGNLLIEGWRKRVLNREVRTLKVTGIVRPADIGPANTVQSSFIGQFCVSYIGKGPESAYTNHGWGGMLLNRILP
jgi:flagellar L-ring protein precursor FlgH